MALEWLRYLSDVTGADRANVLPVEQSLSAVAVIELREKRNLKHQNFDIVLLKDST